jgi:putative peptidoglycan lipid II flippase
VGEESGSRAAASVGAGIFFSKVFGFVRERVFAHFFGAGIFADAWWAALKIPNVIRNLLGEGTLSASLIPVYSEFLAEGRKEEAARFAGAALGILSALAGALALVGIGLAPGIVQLLFSEMQDEGREVLTGLLRILFPMAGIFVVSAWALGILNSHRIFFVSFVAPVFWNLAMIAAMVGGFLIYGLEGSAEHVTALAWGALAGGVLTLLVQIPWLLPHLKGVRLSLGRGVVGVPEAIRNFTPVVAARGVVNISSAIDLILAARLAPGAIAVMGYAQTFSNLPVALFGTGVAAAELPEMSRMRSEAAEVLVARVRSATERALWFLIPSAVGYLALGDVIVAALYQTGQFGSAESLVTWGVLAAYSLGLPASASSRVLSSAFYAVRDTRTPARMAYIRVAISIVVGVSLMFPADSFGVGALRLGAAGLATGSAVGAWTEYLLLRRALARRIGRFASPAGVVLRLSLAAAIAALVGVGIQLALDESRPVLALLETMIPFGVVYLAVTTAFGRGLPFRRATSA